MQRGQRLAQGHPAGQGVVSASLSCGYSWARPKGPPRLIPALPHRALLAERGPTTGLPWGVPWDADEPTPPPAP